MTIIVHKTRIIGTNRVIFSAWEPTYGSPEKGFNHTTITMINGSWYGKVGTHRLPAYLTPRPRGRNNTLEAWITYDIVVRAADEWTQANRRRAYFAIEFDYPEISAGGYEGRITRDSGEIIIDPYRFEEDGEVDEESHAVRGVVTGRR